MGNHQIGHTMGHLAAILLEHRKPKETALYLLDCICDPYRNSDAEFEAADPNNPGHVHPDYVFYTDPNAPLGQLMVEAFAPEGATYDMGDEDSYEKWYEEVNEPFRKRYNFW